MYDTITAEYERVAVASNQSVTAEDIIARAREYVITSGHKCVTLPTDDGLRNYEIAVTNVDSSDYATIVCNSAFAGGKSSMILAPGESVNLIYKLGASATYEWTAMNRRIDEVKWQDWTPTETYTTATPTTSVDAKFCHLPYGVVFLMGSITTTDGAGATALTLTGMPVPPADINAYMPMYGFKSIAGTYTEALPYVDCLDNTMENRGVGFRAFGTWTDDAACTLYFAGFYFADSTALNTLTLTETYTTGTPGSITKVSLGVQIDNCYFFVHDSSSADSNACTNLTVSLPVNPGDMDLYLPLMGLLAIGDSPAYTQPLPYLDLANATGASRLIEMNAYGTGTDGEAIRTSICGVIPVGNWTDFSSDLTFTFGTADPGSITEKWVYTILCNSICLWGGYASSADGNAASSCAATLPVVPMYWSNPKVAQAAHEKVNATWDDVGGHITLGVSAGASRDYDIENFATATDGQAWQLNAGGFYPVEV